jgi:predicted alpha/beta hydrolase
VLGAVAEVVLVAWLGALAVSVAGFGAVTTVHAARRWAVRVTLPSRAGIRQATSE